MKTIKIKSDDGSITFELHIYRAGETVTVFKGVTGTFGAAGGSKKPGMVYVEHTEFGVQAKDVDIDDRLTWEWIQRFMQRGMHYQALLDALRRITTEQGQTLNSGAVDQALAAIKQAEEGV